MPQTECPHVNQLQVAQKQSFLNPRNWACVECGTTDGVWVSVTPPVTFIIVWYPYITLLIRYEYYIIGIT